MKKWMLVAGVTVVAMAALGIGLGLGTFAALAQDETPTPPWPGFGPRGMMGGRWDGAGTGPMHETMVAAMAEALGLTEAQLEDRLEAGETMADIAEAQGLTLEEFQAAMIEAREKALEDAVDQGLLTQEQADWMQEHRRSGWAAGGCPGMTGAGFGGMRGWRFQQ